MIEVRQGHVCWDDVVKHPRTPFLIELTDPETFVRELPAEFKPPVQRNPRSGLPPNVWVGMVVSNYRCLGLLDVRARIRWIRFDGSAISRSDYWIASAWRCENCGTRGRKRPRSGRCPHAEVLCGESELLPQIHWYRGHAIPQAIIKRASRHVWIDPHEPSMRDFREFSHEVTQ